MWKEGSGGYFGHEFVSGQPKHISEVISILSLGFATQSVTRQNYPTEIRTQIRNDCQRKYTESEESHS